MKRKKSPEGGGSWMDTYGDMVTLLLCFFVLLYSISSVDQEKWRAIALAFNPDAEQTTQVGNGNSDKEASTDTTEEVTLNDLYEALQKSVKELGIEDETEIEKGDGYTLVSFKDKVFFDGDSSILKKEGKKVLDEFAKVLSDVSSKVQEVQIVGHTSQGDPNVPNDVRNDRTLSSLRSVEVTIYLQEKNIIDPGKLVSVSYGQFRPVATFKTKKGRAKNRRVEIIITEEDVETHNLQDYYEEASTAES